MNKDKFGAIISFYAVPCVTVDQSAIYQSHAVGGVVGVVGVRRSAGAGFIQLAKLSIRTERPDVGSLWRSFCCNSYRGGILRPAVFNLRVAGAESA